MKTIKILFAMMFAFITTQYVNAQSDKTERTVGIKTQTIKVYGECGMCKKSIEKAAYTVEGVKSVRWNEDTKVLTLKYSSFKKEAADNVQNTALMMLHIRNYLIAAGIKESSHSFLNSAGFGEPGRIYPGFLTVRHNMTYM